MAVFTYSVYCHMGRLNLWEVETQLKKRWPYPDTWFRKQNDIWDRRSNFIYDSYDFDLLLTKIDQVLKTTEFDKKSFLNYALNRWYNYWSARAIEQIFCEQTGVIPAINPKDRLVDFNLKGINFDLKTSVFPRGFGKDLTYAKTYENELINWLYTNQSTGNRYHEANRLFLIVYRADGAHYKLKAEISWMRQRIADYVSTFDDSKLVSFSGANSKTVYSDIIWATQ